MQSYGYNRVSSLRALIAFGILLGMSAAMGAQPAQSSSAGAASDAVHKSSCPAGDAVGEALREASGLMLKEQYDEAIPKLRPLDESACDPRVALLLAAAYEGHGDLPAAMQTLQRAHATWSANDHIAASLARIYFGTSQINKAADVLATFHATNTTPAQEIEVAVVVFLGTHQLRRAEDASRVGYQAYPSLRSILLLANTLQLEGRYKDVISLLEEKRSVYGKAAPFLVTLAQSEYDASMFDVTRSDAEQAIALDPKLYPAHYLLGSVLAKTGAMDGAIQEYRVAIQLSPNQPRTYYFLALAFRAQHKESEEEEVLTRAVAIDPQYSLARCELGRILLNQNRIPEAMTQLNMAVEENASNEQSYLLLAKAYERAGNKEQAEAMAKRFAAVSKANHTEGEKHQASAAGAPSATP